VSTPKDVVHMLTMARVFSVNHFFAVVFLV